jgi:hypothetical protein
MSVDLKSLCQLSGVDPAQHIHPNKVAKERWPGAIEIQVGFLRSLGFMVGFEPLDENPFHGGVWGHFSKLNKRRILQAARWLIPIEGVSIYV